MSVSPTWSCHNFSCILTLKVTVLACGRHFCCLELANESMLYLYIHTILTLLLLLLFQSFWCVSFHVSDVCKSETNEWNQLNEMYDLMCQCHFLTTQTTHLGFILQILYSTPVYHITEYPHKLKVCFSLWPFLRQSRFSVTLLLSPPASAPKATPPLWISSSWHFDSSLPQDSKHSCFFYGWSAQPVRGHT